MDEVEKFLNVIAEIESSGGQNFDHPEIKEGIHQGHRAAGRYGLMPNTVQELTKRAERRGQATDAMRSIASIEDPVVMKQALEENPEIEQTYARQLAEKVLRRQGDPEKAAYTWFSGHNLSPDEVAKRNYLESDYVKKFQALRNKLSGR